MKKIFLLSISFLLLAIPGFCQVQLSQYFLDGTLYNPAFAGSQEAICVSSFGRQQWLGLTDIDNNKVSPLSGVFNLHAPVFSLNSGLGVNLVYDKLGFEQNMEAKINYAYRFQFHDEAKSLAIGIAASFLRKTIDFRKLDMVDLDDPLLNLLQKESGSLQDVDFGIQYQQLKKVYVGISGTNLLESNIHIGTVHFGQKRNVYLTAGYYIKLMEKQRKSLYLIPSLLVKSNLTNVQLDVSARVEYNNLFWAGVSYRYQDAVAVLAGFNLKGFRIGVSYDLATSYLPPVSYGSAEVFLGYCYTIRPKVKLNSLYNTRYL
jgi:type IX secretion system PorP/SprF family membrane protein